MGREQSGGKTWKDGESQRKVTFLTELKPLQHAYFLPQLPSNSYSTNYHLTYPPSAFSTSEPGVRGEEMA